MIKTARHTVKLDPSRALVIEPTGQRVLVTVTVAGANLTSWTITRDQADALVTALEIASAQAADLERSL
ncbi:MAG: hypothetical protein HXX19_15255 [Rhodoferax sp.]|nr:hypothetical protein [Rhodoferax sp.]